MKREEEIKLVASCHISDETSKYQEFYDGFIAGAKWADKTMIDKACEWLQQHQESYDMYDAWSGDFVNFKSLIIDFRKAMEE